MKCEESCDRLIEVRSSVGDELGRRQLEAHLESCEQCRHAARAFDTLSSIALQVPGAPPVGLFERVVQKAAGGARAEPARPGFWLGAGLGAALAASLLLAAMPGGLLPGNVFEPADSEAVYLAAGEPRDLHVAIDLERDMPGATITVMLSGGIAIDGYDSRKELSWNADLQAGVNRLTLPLVATNGSGGELLVRVNHGSRQKSFKINLRASS